MQGCIRCGTAMKPTYKFCMVCGYPAQQQALHTTANNNPKSPPNTSQFVCKSCGRELKRTDRFCGKCGHPVQLQTKQTASTLVCKGCGGKLDVKDRFCIVCGYPVQLQNQKIQSKTPTGYISVQQKEEREKCIAELNRIWSYFKKAQAVYNDYDRCISLGDKYRKEYREHTSSNDDFWDHRIILILLGTFLFFGSFFLIGFGKELPNVIAGIIILIFVAPGIGYLGVYSFILDGRNERNMRNKIKKNDDRLAELALQLTKYYAAYGYCIVDPEYTNPRIIEKLIQIMNFERANTLREAIVTFYHDCHIKEFMAKDWLTSEMGLLNAHGAKSTSVFYPASYFLG